ncbi:hypothetical protein MRB53_037457 [Persea americana]|nr:hypothetical protein MRB53_037457 [Persea americana]
MINGWKNRQCVVDHSDDHEASELQVKRAAASTRILMPAMSNRARCRSGCLIDTICIVQNRRVAIPRHPGRPAPMCSNHMNCMLRKVCTQALMKLCDFILQYAGEMCCEDAS